MKYSVIGSGAIGTSIARQFARQNLLVLVANRRGPASIKPLAEELGLNIKPSELSEALEADIVVLAVPFDAVPGILESAPAWNGRIIVDATNAINMKDFSPADLGGRASSDVVADMAPDAKVVKGFNHIWARVLGREPDDGRGDGRRVLFVSGNHHAANVTVADLMRSMGFEVIDLGRVDEGGHLQQFGGPLTTHSFVSQKMAGGTLADMDLTSASG